MTGIPAALRSRLEAEYTQVRPLPSPLARVLCMTPFAALALLAAPVIFNLRPDAVRLGWFGSWGASLLQVAVGLAVIAAALRESIPGRAWRRAALALWFAVPVVLVVLVTLASWDASPVVLRGGWVTVGAMCLAGSLATAMPAIALAGVLSARAYPTRPAVAGALLGLGAGLMADAGWRLFCHFSEPDHVLPAHLGAVVVAALAGSVLAAAICRAPRRF